MRPLGRFRGTRAQAMTELKVLEKGKLAFRITGETNENNTNQISRRKATQISRRKVEGRAQMPRGRGSRKTKRSAVGCIPLTWALGI